MWTEKININHLSEQEYKKQFALLSAEEKEKVNKLRPDDIRRTLAGRYLLRRIIMQVYSRDDLLISYNRNGKPMLDFCYFNISHSGNYAVCAVSEREIGIDIQFDDKFKKRDKYMLFTTNESAYINNADDINQAFYTIWTMKEAYVKALGKNLVFASEINLISDDNKLINELNGYAFKTESFDDYYLSICERA